MTLFNTPAINEMAKNISENTLAQGAKENTPNELIIHTNHPSIKSIIEALVIFFNLPFPLYLPTS